MNLKEIKNEVSKKRWFIILAVFLYIVSEGLQQELAYQSWKLLIIKIVTSIGFAIVLLTIGSLLGSGNWKDAFKAYWNILIAAFVAVSAAKVFMMLWQYKEGSIEITSVAEFMRLFMSNDTERSYWGISALIGVGVIVPVLESFLSNVTRDQVKPYLFLSLFVSTISFFFMFLEISAVDIWGLRMFSGITTYLLLGWYLERTSIDKRQIIWWSGVGAVSFLFLLFGTLILNQDVIGTNNEMLFQLTSIGMIGFSTACYVLLNQRVKLGERFSKAAAILGRASFITVLFAAPIRKCLMESSIFRGDHSISILITAVLTYIVSTALAILALVVWNLLKDVIRNQRAIWIHASWRFAPGFRMRKEVLPLLFLIVSWGLYISHWYIFEVLYWNIAFDWIWVALVAITVLSLVRLEFSPLLEKLIKAIIIIGLPFWIMCITEVINENNALQMGTNQIWLNYSCYLLLFFIFYAITNQIRIAAVLEAVVMTVFGIANMYVLRFRGSPILPWDLYSVKTAASVASTYNYDLTAQMLMGILYTIWIWLIVYPLKRERWRWYRHLASIVATAAILCICWSGVVMQGKLKEMGIERNIWKQDEGYRTNGFLLSFVENAKDFTLRAPDGYDRETQEKLLAETTEEPTDTDKKDYPNVIVVMNESFADIPNMAEDGILNINQEVTPFINNWNDNVIKGHFLSSVLGGGTAKTEFEFLTGNSGAFYPSGSMPYQQFIHQEMESMASILGNYGYTSVAFHPYLGTGWDRNRVYPLMGFQDFITLDDMPEDMDKVRIYCSDKGDYDKVLEILEEHDKQEGPLFLFNVTMQNHGSYTGSYDNFSVDVQDSNLNYDDLNQYLSLIHLSDQALQQLVDELTAREEDVILCFFGDHMPGLDWSFYTRITPSDSEFERTLKAYTVPFYIWANYDLDLEEESLEFTSANYLGMHLLKLIGVPLTPWYQYLEQMEEQMPIVSAIGYADETGEIHPMDDAAMEYPAMQQYQNMQYYYFYDRSEE